jgi:hypothetical protein
MLAALSARPLVVNATAGSFLKFLSIRPQSAAEKWRQKFFCYLRHRQTAEVCNYHLAL